MIQTISEPQPVIACFKDRMMASENTIINAMIYSRAPMSLKLN